MSFHIFKNKTIQGMLSMVLAMIVFALVNLFVKDTVQRYSIIQVVFFRCFFMLPPVAFAMIKMPHFTFKSFQMKRHILCGITGFIGLYCLYYALRSLPLAEVTTLCFTSIFFVTLFGAFFLKESANRSQWIAVITGFMGVIVIAQPGQDLFEGGLIYALLFSVIDAFIMINARILTRHDSSYLVVFYFSLFSSVLGLFFLPIAWTTPTFPDLLKLICLGIAGGVGQILITKAYSLAEAAFVAPMIYTAILWNILFGFILFSERPTLRLIIGSLIIMSCGLLILRESLKRKDT